MRQGGERGPKSYQPTFAMGFKPFAVAVLVVLMKFVMSVSSIYEINLAAASGAIRLGEVGLEEVAIT